MQTFLPYFSFEEVSKCLDYRRLGKQRVEAKQILEINMALKCWENPEYNKKYGKFLENMVLPTETNQTRGFTYTYENHPAVLMWRGFEFALSWYGYIMCDRWITIGYRDNLSKFFWRLHCNFAADGVTYRFPAWFGKKELKLSHRANLLRKNYDYYKEFGWEKENPELTEMINIKGYYWPVRKGE